MIWAFVSCHFCHTAIGREIAFQNDESARCFQRIVQWTNNHLSCDFRGLVCFESVGVARNGESFTLYVTTIEQTFGDNRNAAGAVHFDGGVLSAGNEVCHQWRARADGVEIINRQFHFGFTREREQMQHRVRRAAGHCHTRNRVVERGARENIARTNIAFECFKYERADIARNLFFARVNGGNAVRAERRESDNFHHRRHRVRGVLSAARAGSGTNDLFKFVQLLFRHFACRDHANRFINRTDRVILTAPMSGHNRPAVQHESGNVQTRERHAACRNRLVAADQTHERVEIIRARHQFNRIGDEVAADERRFHALSAHRNPVMRGDGIKFKRRAACFADALFDVLREVAQMQITSHFCIRHGNADERFL